jgi:hypothetical protein
MDKSFDDNDQSVYKSHILYILPKDPNCVKLLSALESMPIHEEVFVQDVTQLRQRPTWLDGVPILVNKKNNQAHKGQNIYTYARAFQPENFMPAGAVTGGWASFEDGENTGAFDKKFSSLFDAATYDLEEEGAQSAAGSASRAGNGGNGGGANGGEPTPMNEKSLRKQQSEREVQDRAQQMISVRQQQDQLLQSRQRGSAAIPRNAFAEGSDDGKPALRHPPPQPMSMQQRAADNRQPMYGAPQVPQSQPATPQPQQQYYHQQQQQQPQHYYQPQYYQQQQQYQQQQPAQYMQQHYQQQPAQYPPQYMQQPAQYGQPMQYQHTQPTQQYMQPY